jgi:hypothetical protein
MRIALMTLSACLYLLSCSVAPAHEKLPPKSDNNDMQTYYKRNYPAGTVDVSSLSLTNCQNGIKIGSELVLLACRCASLDTQSDSGLRLFLIQSDQNKILYHSKGAEDSYYMKFSTVSQNKIKYCYGTKSGFVRSEVGGQTCP